MRKILFSTIVLLFSLLGIAQVTINESIKNQMIEIVDEGLKTNPKSFANKGVNYDYANNFKVSKIEIPEKQIFPGFEGRQATTFFCKLTYSIEGVNEVKFFKIMCRQDPKSKKMKFYSAHLWNEVDIN